MGGGGGGELIDNISSAASTSNYGSENDFILCILFLYTIFFRIQPVTKSWIEGGGG